MTGTVFAQDGETPLGGVELYVYHTDTEGYYSPGSTRATAPRIHGTVITDSSGRYELFTIRPGAYPAAGVPAHIHYVIKRNDSASTTASKRPAQRFELQFADDPLLSAEAVERAQKEGNFATIQPVERDEHGVWECVRDLRLAR